jgi:hypothetical protein
MLQLFIEEPLIHFVDARPYTGQAPVIYQSFTHRQLYP